MKGVLQKIGSLRTTGRGPSADGGGDPGQQRGSSVTLSIIDQHVARLKQAEEARKVTDKACMRFTKRLRARALACRNPNVIETASITVAVAAKGTAAQRVVGTPNQPPLSGVFFVPGSRGAPYWTQTIRAR